jgi:hypothetical protein
MNLREISQEMGVDGAGSGSFPVANFGSGVEVSGPTP